MVITLMNLLCAYVSCVKLRDLPSDPLSGQASSNNVISILQNNNIGPGDAPIPHIPVNLTVFIKNGGLEGYAMNTIKNRTIYAFEGIPFGESTGGPDRFKPPVPKKPWEGVRQAKKVGDFCVQLHLIRFFIFGSEDCLYLNVYTPQLPSKTKVGPQKPNLPVIVFIHGGAYFFGSGAEYGPAYLLEQDVILVTINYRVGILGFLSTGDSVLPGNNGLKDQAIALKWVHENIEAFGGDPTRVTIMGQSSGAASVHLHMISNMTRAYFSGAISLSGTAFSPWSIANKKYANYTVQSIANMTGCNLKNSEVFVNCLRKQDAYFLAGKLGQLFVVPGIPSAPLAVVIEPDGPDAFLTKHPHEVYAENGVAKIPWICSSTGDEGHFPMLIMLTYRLEWLVKRFWNQGAPTVLDYKFVTENPDQITKQINKFYFGTPDGLKIKNETAFGDLFTDRWFAYALHKSLQAHSTVAPTYSHVFGYKGSHGLKEYIGVDKDKFGVGHIDDLPFIFNMSGFFDGYKTTDPEYAVIKLMRNLIVNFAHTRQPLYTSETGEKFQIWNPIIDPRNISVLQILEEVKMISEPNQRRLKFWETVQLDDIRPWIKFGE